jgi:hypothetical protein
MLIRLGQDPGRGLIVGQLPGLHSRPQLALVVLDLQPGDLAHDRGRQEVG